MKKNIFIPLLIILTLTTVLNLGAVAAYKQRNMQSYLAAGIDKEQRLSSLPGSRIILVGGSNVAFGFKSDLIEQITGYPTINMGLQGSLGIRFSLNSLKPYLHQGDIVIISPEYNDFVYGFVGGDILNQYLIVNPSNIKYLSSIQELLGMINAFPGTHTSAIYSIIDDLLRLHCFLCKPHESVYFRQAFNQFGDITTNQDNPEINIAHLKFSPGNENFNTIETIKVLDRFSDYASENGISVYLVYPPTSKIEDQVTIDIINRLDKKLRQDLTIKILGSISESEFSDQYMFNTFYHLNSKGAYMHTQQVLNWLCAADQTLHCQK